MNKTIIEELPTEEEIFGNGRDLFITSDKDETFSGSDKISSGTADISAKQNKAKTTDLLTSGHVADKTLSLNLSGSKYSLSTGLIGLGYYLCTKDGTYQLSDFYVNLTKWVKTVRDGEPLSYYEGDIVIKDGTTIKINRLAASTLDDAVSFKKYIGNLCGPKAMLLGSPGEVVKAIKTSNKNVKMFEEHEFGYNKALNTYFTGEMVINADKIIEQKTPIKYCENWGNNKLGFNYVSQKQMETVKDIIINQLLPWDDPKIMYNELAFTFYPLIYPLLKYKNPNKFYLMLKGPSGSGKSQMSKWMQSFYGNFQTLLTWTSTDTSINIVGSAFKDAIFAVDDLKMQNFRSENDAKKIMGTLQNYSDSTGRQRANVDLKLRDERIIKGHLLISAEDLVVTESSTMARGIIINVNSKSLGFEKLSEINIASEDFSSFTPYLIQHIFQNYSEETIGDIFENSLKLIQTHPLIKDPNISPDNLPRMINNFAALKTSWQIFSDFLFDMKPDNEKEKYQETFDQNLISLLRDNIERISSYKSEVVFENTLWELIENGTFSLKEVLSNGTLGFSLNSYGKGIGYYNEDRSGKINLVLQLSTALREMKKMIPNFAVSEDTLKTKLQSEKKIKVNPSKKISLNGKKISGVQWTGNIPKSIFGLNDENDPVEQVAEILSGSKENSNGISKGVDKYPFENILEIKDEDIVF